MKSEGRLLERSRLFHPPLARRLEHPRARRPHHHRVASALTRSLGRCYPGGRLIHLAAVVNEASIVLEEFLFQPLLDADVFERLSREHAIEILVQLLAGLDGIDTSVHVAW